MKINYIYVDKITKIQTIISRPIAIKFMKYCRSKVDGKWIGDNYIIIEQTI